jgi:hypothetical protein
VRNHAEYAIRKAKRHMSERERFIYIGPNVPLLGLKGNTIYQSKAMPAELARIAETKPVVKALYVSTDGLMIAMRNLNKKGSLEQLANETMLTLARKQI